MSELSAPLNQITARAAGGHIEQAIDHAGPHSHTDNEDQPACTSPLDQIQGDTTGQRPETHRSQRQIYQHMQDGRRRVGSTETGTTTHTSPHRGPREQCEHEEHDPDQRGEQPSADRECRHAENDFEESDRPAERAGKH